MLPQTFVIPVVLAEEVTRLAHIESENASEGNVRSWNLISVI